MKRIAIIGGTGMLGRPVTNELISAGFDVTLLVRDLEKTRQIFGAEIKAIKGDVSDINSIRQFLDGQDRLYLNLSIEQTTRKDDFQPEREGLINILEAVKNSSVQRIGYLSSLVHFYQGQNGFYWWAFDIKRDAVAKIKASGVAYSIFYASTFMESFDQGGYRKGNMIALSGTSRHKMYLMAGRDYGKQVAKAFELDNGSNEYVVQGPEGFTADEAAEFYVKHYTNKKLRVVKAPFGMLKFLGKLSSKFNYGARILEAINNYPERFEAEKTWEELGTPDTRFIDYIKTSENIS